MRYSLWAAVTCLGALAGQTTEAAEPSLCARLADEARRLPTAAWDGSEPLKRWIQPMRPSRGGASAATKALANDPIWRDKVSAPSADRVGVQHLQGAPVYLIDFVSGTAHCQQYVLAEVREGQPTQELESPLQPNMALCMGGWARFARVMNQPALVMGDAPSASSPEGEYRIAGWTARGWAPSCRLKLRLRTRLTPLQRFCAPEAAVCAQGQAVAFRLATDSQAGSAVDADLASGQPQEVLAALNPPLRDPGAVGDSNLPLPTFGAKDSRGNDMRMQFSNSSAERLPVLIGDRWWLAVVGRAGIGWRVGDAVNVALFAPPGRAADAVASYQFGFEQTGLLAATAVDDPR
ncbi:hypothetical protein J2X20_004743 [Pelomonas saccharophila]|uniref:Uncharacterized protein n=1 Tax=Roseateles saccharophilus TaxID=304 RepID=A0ABU1YT81_ROSSA|nr:hypothetical protein [Roseateles saccharophilus]MDR7272069.1 hypothetical protein [Roseateles saccharophilus]